MPPSIISRIYNALNNERTPAEADGTQSDDNKDSNGTDGASKTMGLYFSDMDGRLLRADKRTDQEPPVSPRRAFHQRESSLYDTTPIDLDQFITLLPTVVEKCETRNLKKCEPIKALLKRLVLESSDVLAPYAFWDPDKLYTRNLVATDGKNYTILLLCWNPGKESPIHDHPCEGCWVKTVEGCVKETIYEPSEEGGEALVAVRENIFHPTQLSYIEDSLGYHKVGNIGPEVAMTLHVYIPPPKSCRIWLDKHATLGEAMTVPVCLYSAYGRRIDHSSEPLGASSLTGPCSAK